MTGEGQGLETGASQALRGMYFFFFNALFFNSTNASDYLISNYAYNPNPPQHVH